MLYVLGLSMFDLMVTQSTFVHYIQIKSSQIKSNQQHLFNDYLKYSVADADVQFKIS